ncbi:alpha/beta hydrolase-fold protein [Draconibacterium sp. IB214405]|uniref:alpha/beta hydrolase-fold protein n=1 Tax=Draconibacterium sp. IB214405 TaxID=3097352 RepID=UPI002A13E4B0|nr:alpha/beta hydrolase-fold protein [Draconibacterium sp. IB214405]MDX8338558.1 alpha/beta hydrolase-fold protein [Draconibacterium sp. IB214405]
MNIKIFLLLSLLAISGITAVGQQEATALTFSISVNDEMKASFNPDGRLLIYLSKTEKPEPRYSSVFDGKAFIFGKNFHNWKPNEIKEISGDNDWIKTSEWDFNSVPQGTYYVQALWVQNRDAESRSNTPGNLYTTAVEINTNKTQLVKLSFSETIPERKLEDHELVEYFEMESPVLTDWWNKSMHLKASVLLPSGYKNNPDKKYPVRYNVAGYGGRYTRINSLIKNEEFMSWWTSEDAPQIITVFLDGEGPFGDCYQLDSENSGPYGEALTKELIPQIEKQYRIEGTAKSRFVDGCSTGGWVSLALQLIYPETFNGCWSYSPDPVSFAKMQLVNVYQNENAFYNDRGYLRPSMRDIYGEPRFSIKQEITAENVEGYSNTYVTSGGQWGAWNALYSPKGKDGLPVPIFDPVTGAVNKEAAEHWEKYDLLKHTASNWPELGPKLQGKINIWMGDMDNFYLNNAMRDFDEYMKNTTNPKSDAQIEFTPMKGHCSNYSHKKVLTEIQQKLDEME